MCFFFLTRGKLSQACSTRWLLFSSPGCTSEVINPLHEDKPASTWKLPRCFGPTHVNISLDLVISKKKKGG